jgi:hypothetical protein
MMMMMMMMIIWNTYLLLRSKSCSSVIFVFLIFLGIFLHLALSVLLKDSSCNVKILEQVLRVKNTIFKEISSSRCTVKFFRNNIYLPEFMLLKALLHLVIFLAICLPILLCIYEATCTRRCLV